MAWLYYLSIHLLFCVGLGSCQQQGWVNNQINATLCQWVSARAAVIRDSVYVDGGYQWWLPGFQDGSYGTANRDTNPRGLVFVLNFSVPFNTSQNISDVFSTISGAAGDGAANNIHPLYYDGAMFANDGEYYTYGGLVTQTKAFAAPHADDVQGYEEYWYGAPRSFSPGFVDGSLPDGITRYITFGAAVSVPSENKGFYFSGLKSSTSGSIFYNPNASAIVSQVANVTSDTLISVDLANQRSEKWENQSLPASVPSRASAELAWVPVGKNGVLIAIGGVEDPVFAQLPSLTLTDAQAAIDQSTGQGFMTTVSIYDIDSATWFSQETSGTHPPGLAQGCTVVASSQDYSSHNIYWYGGFDGIDQTQPFSDDVYVLSVPSFTWTKVYSGNNTHGRASHKCVKPYPDQMLVIGGYPQYRAEFTCLENNIVQIFNLSAATWMTSYDPAIWSNYSVPAEVVKVIGGTGSGGATQLGPSSWSNDTLKSIFSVSYERSRIHNWYPYSPTPINNSQPVVSPTPTPVSSSGIPSWLAPVLGTVLGLVAVSAILVCVLLWRRRRYFRRDGTMTESSDRNRLDILSWVRGASGAGGKAPTVTSDDVASSPTEEMESTVGGSGSILVEAGGREVHEMMDTSRPQELLDTGMRYLPAAGITGLRPSPSDASHNSHLSQSSMISGVSGSSLGEVVSPHVPRPDSPSLGSAHRSRIVSGITEASSRNSAHLRQLSLDSEVSDASAPEGLGISRLEATTGNGTDEEQQVRMVVTSREDGPLNPSDFLMSPVSPPTPNAGDGSDYITGRPNAANSSGLGASLESEREKIKIKRKSNFGEMLEE